MQSRFHHFFVTKLAAIALLAIGALLVSGCAGTNFVKPDPASFTLGQTTKQEVIKQMGKPYRIGSMLKNGVTLETTVYAYARSGGAALYPRVIPARSQGFYYLNGTLVGTEFTSSFKDDATDFDEAKVGMIEKEKTTRAEVVQLLGTSGGEYIFPLAANPNDRALVYLYSQTKGSAFNLRFYNKTLIVSYNAQGIVTNVEYTAQGNKE
ncbi:MAG: hypothetical protein LBI92_02965 [Azoarcus sp.]|nr:hypothetical protein [Azoarcus sp.]